MSIYKLRGSCWVLLAYVACIAPHLASPPPCFLVKPDAGDTRLCDLYLLYSKQDKVGLRAWCVTPLDWATKSGTTRHKYLTNHI